MVSGLVVALLTFGLGDQAVSRVPPQPAAAPEALQQSKPDPWPPPGILRMGDGIEPPKIQRDVKPDYTADAMRAKIQGAVELEAVVLADGRVGDVIVTRSLDKEHGLDGSAVAALKQWRFKPAVKDGAVIPVVVKVEMTFSIRDKR